MMCTYKKLYWMIYSWNNGRIMTLTWVTLMVDEEAVCISNLYPFSESVKLVVFWGQVKTREKQGTKKNIFYTQKQYLSFC